MKYFFKSPFSYGIIFLLVDWLLLFATKTLTYLAEVAHDYELFIYNKDGTYNPYLLTFLNKILELWYGFHAYLIDLIQQIYYSFSALKVIDVTNRPFLFDLLSTSQSFILGFLVGMVFRNLGLKDIRQKMKNEY
jgi:hypothetical protein